MQILDCNIQCYLNPISPLPILTPPTHTNLSALYSPRLFSFKSFQETSFPAFYYAEKFDIPFGPGFVSVKYMGFTLSSKKSWLKLRNVSLTFLFPSSVFIGRKKRENKNVFISLLCVLTHSSPVQLFATLWTGACQAPRSMGFSRQEYWSGLPCLSPGYLPDPGVEPASLLSPALADKFSTTIAMNIKGYKVHKRVDHPIKQLRLP